MLAAVGAVIVLFFLARLVFRSDAVALLGALGFAFTPTFLNWTTTVRPNTLELFLIFATLFACILVAAAIIPNLNVFHKPNTWRIVRSGAVPVLALVGVLVVFHASEASGDWDYKMSKPLDTGLEVGDWLQERYPEDVRIMTDWDTFYIPPYFVQTSSVTPFERKERRDAYKAGAVRDVIVSFDPDVIVISHPQGFYEFVNVLPLLTSDPVIESRDYKLVKQFDYDRADRQRYGYEHVLVYEKGSLSSRLSKRPAE